MTTVQIFVHPLNSDGEVSTESPHLIAPPTIDFAKRHLGEVGMLIAQ